VDADGRDAFFSGVRRRAQREPLAYIIGEQSFMGLPFVVSPDVLIPEQDTENLVEEALRHLEDGSRILDLCTGSGCILLSLLRYSNGCTGVGTDLSPEALRIAQENARILGLDAQTIWLQGDLFSALENASGSPERLKKNRQGSGAVSAAADVDPADGNPPDRYPADGNLVDHNPADRDQVDEKQVYGNPTEGNPADRNPEPAEYGKVLSGSGRRNGPVLPDRFDLIISNPPYIPTAECPHLQKEVCSEPSIALDGGADGMDFYRRIIPGAWHVLDTNGFLLMELGINESSRVRAMLENGGFSGIEIKKDLNGIDRIILARKVSGRAHV
jgi:release factor glutamine methyltransferase